MHELSQDGAIDQVVARIAGALLDAGPQAIAQTKALIEQVGTRVIDQGLMEQTAGLIAAVRASGEGREGVSSFLEKRRPAWLTS